MTLNVVASGSQTEWYYAIEDGSGDISETVPAFVPIRFNTSDVVRDTTQIDSDEINNNRQREKSRQGTYSIAGTLVFNLSYTSHDALIEAAFQSTFTSQVTDTQITFSVVAADNSLNDSGSGFVVAGFAVGQYVDVSGFTGDPANNIVDAKITALTASKMTIGGAEGDALVDEAAGDSVTIATAGDFLDVGQTVPTYALLKRNTDTSVDVLFRHVRVGDIAFAGALNQSVLVTVGAVGESQEIYTVPGGSTFATATTTEMMVPTIGSMQDDLTTIAYLSEYNVSFGNGMDPLFVLFQRPAYSVQNGVFVASGGMSAYQPDSVLLTKFIDETETDHIVKFIDLAGNFYRIILPDVLYTQLSDPVSGPGAITEGYTFTAGYDGSTTARIERSV